VLQLRISERFVFDRRSHRRNGYAGRVHGPVARGPGRSGLAALSSSMRALGRAPRMGARACVGWRPGGRSGRDHGFHAKAESQDFLKREGQSFARVHGRAVGAVSRQRPSGVKPPSARRARLPGKRSGSWSGRGCFTGADSLRLADPCGAVGKQRSAACRGVKLIILIP
jgi:hypothetical protein